MSWFSHRCPLSSPRPHCPDGPDAVDSDFLPHSTVAGLIVELPEVRLDQMQQQHSDAKQNDDDDCALSCAELFASEWMTYADVPASSIITIRLFSRETSIFSAPSYLIICCYPCLYTLTRYHKASAAISAPVENYRCKKIVVTFR